MECKKCGGIAFHKAGFVRGLQRYKCKACGCCNTNTLTRCATMQVKRDALRLYAVGLGLRTIGKIVGFSNVAILKRMKEFGEIAEKFHKEQLLEGKEIEVIELDELQHLIQKKEFKFKYGRLSIDKTKEVVILPSRTEQKKTEKKS